MDRPTMKAAFGGTKPRILSWPHRILPLTEASLRTVLGVTSSEGGVWGAEPLVVEDGSPFLAPQEGLDGGEFVLWELPGNQEELWRYVAGGGDSSRFGMVTSTRTSQDLLRRMYAELDTMNISHYHYYVDRLADWIEGLGWAYVPLDEAAGRAALFVCSQERAAWVEAVDPERSLDGQAEA